MQRFIVLLAPLLLKTAGLAEELLPPGHKHFKSHLRKTENMDNTPNNDVSASVSLCTSHL